jgi:hypothetical protein
LAHTEEDSGGKRINRPLGARNTKKETKKKRVNMLVEGEAKRRGTLKQRWGDRDKAETRLPQLKEKQSCASQRNGKLTSFPFQSRSITEV